jgi:hypothetical protein
MSLKLASMKLMSPYSMKIKPESGIFLAVRRTRSNMPQHLHVAGCAKLSYVLL